MGNGEIVILCWWGEISNTQLDEDNRNNSEVNNQLDEDNINNSDITWMNIICYPPTTQTY